MNNEIESIIINDNPDKEIEIFWLNFKQSIINFMKRHNLDIPILHWSDILNLYQEKKEYSNIKKHIQIFISYYCIYIFKVNDPYNTCILWLNVKRWNKINKNFLIKDDDIYYFNIYYILLDIYRYLLNNNNINEEFREFFRNITEHFKKTDINLLLDLCIKYKLPFLLDKINNYFKLEKYISEKYKVNVVKKMSGKKIIHEINNINLNIKN